MLQKLFINGFAQIVLVSNVSVDNMQYTETDVKERMDKTETINFPEVKEVAEIKFWYCHMGHVLGAAIFTIEIVGVKLLYTGGFSRQGDGHWVAADIPNIRPDILIIKSTYAKHEEQEAIFCNTVHNIAKQRGRSLIPIFAFGRALDFRWVSTDWPDLHDITILVDYALFLVKKCLAM